MSGTLLAPLLALAGQCFVGDVGLGSRDVHCFTAMYGGQHVRDVQVVTKAGRAVYRGETLYGVEGGAVSFTYLSSIGGIGRGTATLAPGDWRFTVSMRPTPAAAPQSFATRWQWRGMRAYSVSGGPAPITYRRTRNR